MATPTAMSEPTSTATRTPTNWSLSIMDRFAPSAHNVVVSSDSTRRMRPMMRAAIINVASPAMAPNTASAMASGSMACWTAGTKLEMTSSPNCAALGSIRLASPITRLALRSPPFSCNIISVPVEHLGARTRVRAGEKITSADPSVSISLWTTSPRGTISPTILTLTTRNGFPRFEYDVAD